MHSQDDIHYALETTKVLREPDRRIDTFGETRFEFQLISELMDRTGEVRIRTGSVEAMRPRILRPSAYNEVQLEGFDPDTFPGAEDLDLCWRARLAGHRVLVFSQLMAVLSIAENCLAAWGVRYDPKRAVADPAQGRRFFSGFARVILAMIRCPPSSSVRISSPSGPSPPTVPSMG